METKHVCASICDRLPTPLSANHPWLVDWNIEAEEDDSRDHIDYTVRDPLSHQRCQIPSHLGKRIRGCSYGWVILSNHPHNDMWSLWNPMTSKIIRLPWLISRKGPNIIQQCCLSSPPDEPGSVFMVTAERYAIVFCRLDRKRKKLKWVEMSYAKQMRSIAGCDSFLYSLTSCNSKVYALTTVRSNLSVVHIDIMVKGREIVISLLPYMEVPYHYMNGCLSSTPFLIGCCTELFYVKLGLNGVGHITKETVGAVLVFKLDMTNKRWEEMKDFKDAAFFLDLAHDYSAFYSAAVPSGLGGYVHFLDRSGKVIHSYDFESKTIALSSMPACGAPLLECRLHGEDTENEMRVSSARDGNSNSTRIEAREENMEPCLLNFPFDVLKVIMEFCVGVEYLNFRATCKKCQSAAPVIQWSKGGRLHTYSLVSPWLMVLDKELGVISFIDPMFGDKYFIKTPRELIGDLRIYCSMYGWLLIRRHEGPLTFFNPFTSDIRELPFAPYLDSYCFSAPPTSSDCMVVGFTTRGKWPVYIHFVGREPSWRRFHLNFGVDGLRSFHFATLYRRNLYALYNNGGLGFIDTDNPDFTWCEGPRSSCTSPKQNFLMKCDEQLLLVVVSEFGECVEVFKMNDSTEWEKTESLGRYTIYICGKACLCIEAKTPEMANKIYFPRLHSENRKIVFYSLETRRYHTSDVEESFGGDFMGTKHHLDPHVWIEPSWL
ncbi:hypothetical protein Hanom_Chr01g00085911 [Helianthus anomalus]